MIIGKSVYLRIAERADAERIRSWRNSREVNEFHANRDQISDIQQELWISRVLQNKDWLLFMICLPSQEAIGVAQIKNIDHRNQNAEVGIYIGRSEDRKGITALEAFHLLCDYAFGYLNMHKIYGHVLAENKRAIEMNDLFGLKIEAVYKEELFYENKFHDNLRVSVFSEDYYKSLGAKMFKGKQ